MVDSLKWKTILTQNNHSFLINLNNDDAGIHPLVIFYNDDDEMIYYLSGASKKEYHNDILRTNKGHLLKKDENYDYIKNDTVINLTSIYRCHIDDFISYFQLDEKYANYYQIDIENQKQILEKLYINHFRDDLINLKTIKFDDNNNQYKEIVYLSQNNLDYAKQQFDNLGLEETILKEIVKTSLGQKSLLSGIINESINEFVINNPNYKRHFVVLKQTYNKQLNR